MSPLRISIARVAGGGRNFLLAGAEHRNARARHLLYLDQLTAP